MEEREEKEKNKEPEGQEELEGQSKCSWHRLALLAQTQPRVTTMTFLQYFYTLLSTTLAAVDSISTGHVIQQAVTPPSTHAESGTGQNMVLQLPPPSYS